MPKRPMPDVIVLLPGITGSVLEKDGKQVWGLKATTLLRSIFSKGNDLRKKLAIPHDDPDVDDLGRRNWLHRH